MNIWELIWIFIVMYFLYRLFFAPSKPRGEHRYEVPPEPVETERETTRTRDEILEEMRTIFGEESTTRKPQEKPPQRQRTERPTYKPPPPPPPSKYDRFTGTDFKTTAEGTDADLALKDVLLESPGLRDKRTADRSAFEFLMNLDEIRKGVIVSEVLGKPKSRRRRNI